MTHKLFRTIQYGFAILAVLAVSYFMGVHTMLAKAGMLVFSPATCYTAAATSTLTYMTPGVATTTATCPMGQDGADSATLAIQVNASSTLSTFNIYVEESMDGLDWYPVPFHQEASTTNPFLLATRPYSSFAFASSTVGSTALATSGNGIGVNGTQNRNHYEIDVPVRMKRVRAHTSITGGNGGVWMQIIPKISI